MSRTFFDVPAVGTPRARHDRQGEPLLILGASTRAAAHSAIRAGFAPCCGDLFADLDLRACAKVLNVGHYPRGLIAAAADVPCIPWIYTGGLENHSGLVRRISQTHPLCGNGSEVLAQVRDPWKVAQVLADSGLPFLKVWPRGNPPPSADGSWMQKPLRGAAGRGIAVWEGDVPIPDVSEGRYFQERRDGVPISGLFLATSERAILLEVTRQLVGVAAVHAPPFAWCGTIVPSSVSHEIRSLIARIGEVLAARFRLRGLFGCDFLLAGGISWLTEVNPRYPASTELVEHRLGVPLLDWHRRACELVVPPSGGRLEIDATHDLVKPPEGGTTNGGTTNSTANVFGKIVLYADRDVQVPDLSRFVHRPRNWLRDRPAADSRPYLADIPVPGSQILDGWPICTLFARARSEDECLAKLIRRAARFERRFR